jgi:hypothetical protein
MPRECNDSFLPPHINLAKEWKNGGGRILKTLAGRDKHAINK